jgi:gluconolactonase
MKVLGMGWVAVWLSVVTGCGATEPVADQSLEMETAGVVERLHPALDRLVPADAVIEKVAGGFVFIEGPVWIPGPPGHLLFSDIPGNTVYQWSTGEGTKVFLRPVLPEGSVSGGVGGSNGLTLDPQGRLILCEHGNRRIARLNADGSRTTLADRYDDKRLNSPNDIVFHSSGAAFFTDPPYGLEGGDDSPAKELLHNGIYRLDTDGTVTLLTADQTRPNGIGLSPDERTLYVANSDDPPRRLWMSYPVLDDLTLGEGTVFFDANDLSATGLPDGLTLDRNGNIFASGPGGVLVISPEGKHLGTIAPHERPANAGWGDDGSTLYMTAHSSLYRIRLTASGR